jgi:hypothetical protein
MSNPTSLPLTGTNSSTGINRARQARKRPAYQAPTILTYTEDQMLRDMPTHDGPRGTRIRRV